MNAPISILDAMADPALFGPNFPSSSWSPWRCCAAALFGLTNGLSADDQRFIRRRLGTRSVPSYAVREGWLVIGRRGGKSRFAALVAVFLACFRDYTELLAPGERGTLMVVASDRRQARNVHGYISGLLHAVPMIEALIDNETKEAIELTNGITIEIHTANYRAIRGYTVVGAICDEVAFWRSEDAANPDAEILNALRPSMATVPGSLLLCISSPYARRGELWRAYRDYYGRDHDRVLVWQADTRTMNPTVPSDVIEQAYVDDEAVAASEYGAQFRRDLESYISREAIEAVTVDGRLELPPVSDTSYAAFVDPSGGSRDSMTIAVAHQDKDHIVVDAVREVKPPFSPEAVVGEFASLLKTYRVGWVAGDRYAGEWPREQFRKREIDYRVSDRAKSELYRDLLPLLNSGRIELLDLPSLRSQLGSLERRTTRAGKDVIDHSPGGRDDVVNAVAGAAMVVARQAAQVPLRLVNAHTPDSELSAEERRARDAEEAERAARVVTDAIKKEGCYWPNSGGNMRDGWR